MELWIRSQDKTTLIRSYEIYIVEYGKDSYVVRAKRTSHILGAYKTMERALEILDEIQRILIPKGIIKFDSLLKQEDIETLRKRFDNNYIVVNKNVELLQPFETLVYEMPKE